MRGVIRKHAPKGIAEQMQYGMIGYVVPHKVYPPGYHCDPSEPLPFSCLASQKNYMALYLMTVYQDPAVEAKLREGFKARGKKLDMGKSCIRFRKLDDLPLDVIADVIAAVPVDEYIRRYEAARPAKRSKGK